MSTPLPSTRLRHTALALLLGLAVAASGAARAQDSGDPPGRAARISFTVGQVSLQPAGTEVWTSEILNRPFATGDRLWAEREARAEVHLGSAAIRLGGETGLELINVDDRSVQFKQTAGSLSIRVRALASGETFEIDTPTAALSLIEPGEYRIDIDENAGILRVAALSGQIAVTADGEATTVRGGNEAEYSDQGLAAADVHPLPAGDAFDQWVLERDRREDRAGSTRYVSRELTGYEDLDDYGSWQVVDDYGPVWTPVVSAGWAPYHSGRWAWVAPWGWTWVDAAPWGFAPFHYGRWINLDGRWGWAPGPRRAVPVYAPALVGWIGRPGGGVGVSVAVGPAANVGWFPLGWNEVYVPSYRASDGYVRNVNVTNLHVTNEYVTTYVNNANRPVMAGAPARVFRNQTVPGAVTATPRGAFIASEPVQQHRSDVPREWLAAGAAANAAPAIAPSLQSVGRRAPVAPAIDPGLWNRPVVARGAPPPAPAPFEAQRRAVIANGGQPVPVTVGRTPRSDIVRVAPAMQSAPEAARATYPAPGRAPQPPVMVAPPRPAGDRPPLGRPPAERFVPADRAAPPPRAPTPAAAPPPRPPPEMRREEPPRPAARESAAPPRAPAAQHTPDHPARNDPR